MLRAIAVAGPRAWRRWRGEGAAVGGTDGARLATAPDGRVAIVDGQIHNRAELLALTGCDPAIDDARLVLAVHDRAGDDTPDRIVGDVALAIWDGRRRRLIAAVDPGGYRPIVLAEIADGLIVASEARALFASGEIDRVLDDRRVAEWLALMVPADSSATLFAGVRRVAPGHRAIWTPAGLATERWWRPEDRPPLRLGSHVDYVEAVRTMLDAAVACRIAGDARIGSHLSGGLDSGIVTALAARRLQAAGRRLTAFTAAPTHDFPPEPGRFGDEWPHAAAVAAGYPGIDHVRIANDALSIADVQALREPAQDLPLVNTQNATWVAAIDREAAARGITVMLTGSAGNMSVSYDGAPLLRHVLRHRPLRGASALLQARRVQRWSWRRTATTAADAILPDRWMHRLRAVAGRRPRTLADYSLIAPDFAARTGIAARAQDEPGDLSTAHRDDGRALRLAVLARSGIQGEFAAATRRLHGIDTRDPTADRRVMELCLSIPDDQFLHRGTPRAIARAIGQDLLPPRVTAELRRGRQSADWAWGIEAALPAIAADLASLCAGRTVPDWIDLDRIARAVARWPGAAQVTADDAIEWTAVTRALAAGRFVRRIEGSNQ